MKLRPLALPGAYVIELAPHRDDRGFFARSFCADTLAGWGLVAEYPQWSVSFNEKPGTLRGLHYQAIPHLETKLVRCTAGAVFDVIVDLRPNSSHYGRWEAVELSAANHETLYVPAGFAHGFQTLSPGAELLYAISERFIPGSARGVRWNDPALGIPWPDTAMRIISERDRDLPLLADAVL